MSQKQTDIDIDSIDKNALCINAYRMGYEHTADAYHTLSEKMQQCSDPSEMWLNGSIDDYPVSDIVKENTVASTSYNRMIDSVEQELGLDMHQDWDNAGVYGIIEDCAVSWDAGAYAGLMNNEYNPDEVPFIDTDS